MIIDHKSRVRKGDNPSKSRSRDIWGWANGVSRDDQVTKFDVASDKESTTKNSKCFRNRHGIYSKHVQYSQMGVL